MNDAYAWVINVCDWFPNEVVGWKTRKKRGQILRYNTIKWKYDILMKTWVFNCLILFFLLLIFCCRKLWLFFNFKWLTKSC